MSCLLFHVLCKNVSTDVIRCGNYNTGVSCRQPATDKITLDFGAAVVPAHNEDNTDYESEIQIFLPFAGFVNLNNAYAGKTIALQYVINVVTGNGLRFCPATALYFKLRKQSRAAKYYIFRQAPKLKPLAAMIGTKCYITV